MIVRTWMAYAKPENARAYRDHLTAHVIPKLQKLQGFLGLELCQAERGDRVELLVISRWQSMDAIKAFAGPKPERRSSSPAPGPCWRTTTTSSSTTRWCSRRLEHDHDA